MITVEGELFKMILSCTTPRVQIRNMHKDTPRGMQMKMLHREEVEPTQTKTSHEVKTSSFRLSDVLQMFLGPFLCSSEKLLETNTLCDRFSYRPIRKQNLKLMAVTLKQPTIPDEGIFFWMSFYFQTCSITRKKNMSLALKQPNSWL